MKYTDLTKEQQEKITPYLRDCFESEIIAINKIEENAKGNYKSWIHSEMMQVCTNSRQSRLGYQQCQKDMIEFLDNLHKIKYFDLTLNTAMIIEQRIVQLKFESELE